MHRNEQLWNFHPYASSYTAEPGATPPGNGVREYNPRKIFEI